MNRLFLLFFFFIAFNQVKGQSITGHFPNLKLKTIRLIGFDGLEPYSIDSFQTTEHGDFILNYSEKDFGVGYIADENNNSYFVILENESVELKGNLLEKPESISIIEGPENKIFVSYAGAHAKREQALSVWVYLQKMYQGDKLFSNQKIINRSIETEIKRIEKQDNDILAKFPINSYVHWYLPLRKLITSVSFIAQYRTSEIPATIAAFKRINYNDSRLYKSGLFKDLLESQFWLLENRGELPLDSIFKDINDNIQNIFNNVSTNEKLYNELAKFLFDYFEKHSLYNASEYLSLKALTQTKITILPSLLNQLESYRKMKIGNTAPDINFEGDIFKNGIAIEGPIRLTDINANFKVVIFGASWCRACSEQISDLLPVYSKWKAKGVEVVFISLDTDKNAFLKYSSIMPFLSICNYKKWENQAVKDFYIYSSPTIILLDKNNKIILRPKFIKVLDTWVDYKMEIVK